MGKSVARKVTEYDSINDLLNDINTIGDGLVYIRNKLISIKNNQIVNPHIRTKLLRVATFGDSTANLLSTNADIGFYSALFPASGATTIGMHATKSNLPSFYSLAEFIANGGISGQGTTSMLGRDLLAAGAARKATADIIDLSPDIVLFHGGSINNLYPNKSESQILAAIPVCIAEHIELVQRFLTAGIPVIDSGIFGFGLSGDTGFSFVKPAIVEINRQLRNAAELTDKWFFIDPANTLCDSKGEYLPNISNDGIHLNSFGSDLLSAMQAKICKIVFGTPESNKFNGLNLMPNPVFASLTSDSKGTYPAGFTFGLAAVTITDSVIKFIDGNLNP